MDPFSRRAKLRDSHAHAIAALLCLAGVLLAAFWAWTLPIFLSPDEDSHYDYALTLYTNGLPQPADHVLGRDTHPAVAYLMTATHAREQRLDPFVGADSGYGSAAYYRALAARAPAARRSPAGGPRPYIDRLYPAGYYALAALAISAGERAGHGSVVAEFFAARLLSVLLVAPTLWFTWLILRELRFGTRASLALLAATALLPLTAWMGGSVQPDVLVCALAAPGLYLALRARRASESLVVLIALGLDLAALAATKQQYFVALYVPVALALVVRVPLRRAPMALAAITLPPLAAFLATEPYLHAASATAGICQNVAFTQLSHAPLALGSYALHVAGRVLAQAFMPGPELESFWLRYTAYRTSEIVIVDRPFTNFVASFIGCASFVLAALFALRTAIVAARIAHIARRRSIRLALQLATSNVVLNAFLTYFVLLIAFEMTIRAVIPLQGRYFLPFVTAVWYACVSAPGVLPRRFGRAAKVLVIGSLAAFGLSASLATFPSLHDRFYSSARAMDPQREVNARATAVVHAGTVTIAGVAIDLRDAAPAREVVLRIDDGTVWRARVTGVSPELACESEASLARAGYSQTLSTAHLRPGRHKIAIFVVTPWARDPIDSGTRVIFATS